MTHHEEIVEAGFREQRMQAYGCRESLSGIVLRTKQALLPLTQLLGVRRPPAARQVVHAVAFRASR